MGNKVYNEQEVKLMVENWIYEEVNSIDAGESFPIWLDNNPNWRDQLILVDLGGLEYDVTRSTLAKMVTLAEEED